MVDLSQPQIEREYQKLNTITVAASLKSDNLLGRKSMSRDHRFKTPAIIKTDSRLYPFESYNYTFVSVHHVSFSGAFTVYSDVN
jgi:hypothetical protein